MTYTGIYTAYMNAVAVTAAITLVQIKAGTSRSLVILRASVSQSSSTTSAMQRVQINRKSAAATVTSFTAIPVNASAPAADAAGGTAATGTNASVEGTDTAVVIAEVFNVLNGWLWLPTPDEVITVPAGGIIGLKFPAAPGASTTYTASMTFAEIG